MQNYYRIYDYIHEYWRHLYDVYARHGIAYLTTYYHINRNKSIWDNEKMMGGSYEKVGNLSGLIWDRYLLFPIYFVSETQTVYDGQEIGYVNEGETDIVIPSDYGIIPLPYDIVKFDQQYLVDRPENDTYSVYMVGGVKKQSPSDKTYWQLHCNVLHSVTTTEIETHQVADTYVFFDYDKKMHTVQDSISLTRMLNKSEAVRKNLKNLYDTNSGFYFI